MQLIEFDCLSNTIGYLLNELTNLSTNDSEVTKFTAHSAPKLLIEDYLVRLHSYLNCSNSCFIFGIIYLDRITQQSLIKSLNKFNVHRLILISTVIGIKFLDDFFYSNSFYARVGGISLKEFNELEKEFLCLLDFKLHIDSQTFQLYLKKLEQIEAIYKKQFAKPIENAD